MSPSGTLIGPTIEFHLPLRLSITVDALYKRLGYEYQQTIPGVVTTRTVATSWEFPGLGVRQVRDVANVVTEIDNAPEFNKRNDIGFVFGGGVAFKLGRVRVSPEFRYVRWGSEAFRDPVRTLLRTNRNQGDFLIGFTF